jgi:hypothetical protein
MYHIHFGAATVNSYDAAGSYGLSSQVSNVPGSGYRQLRAAQEHVARHKLLDSNTADTIAR